MVDFSVARGGAAFDSDGAEIGSVDEVFTDRETGEPSFVTVNTGMFGSKTTFVPLADASVDGNDVHLPYDKSKIKDAPSIDPDAEISDEEQDRLYEYYGLGDPPHASRRSEITEDEQPAASLEYVISAFPRRRSTPADDPLAPERTRWLSDAVGGGGRLAAMLGVSASQTSRWASGHERPGVEAAPRLIDLEHVLARVRLVWAEPAASSWLTSANAHLGGAMPLAVLQLEGPGPVLTALDAGTWGSAA